MDALGDALPWLTDAGRASIIAAALFFSYRLIRAAYVDAIERYKTTNSEIIAESKELKVKVAELETKVGELGGELAKCRAESFLSAAREKAMEERVKSLEERLARTEEKVLPSRSDGPDRPAGS